MIGPLTCLLTLAIAAGLIGTVTWKLHPIVFWLVGVPTLGVGAFMAYTVFSIVVQF